MSVVSTAPVQLAAAFDTPSIDYGLLAPMLIVFGVAVVGAPVEAFMPRLWRHEVQFGLAAAGLIGAFVALVLECQSQSCHIAYSRPQRAFSRGAPCSSTSASHPAARERRRKDSCPSCPSLPCSPPP